MNSISKELTHHSLYCSFQTAFHPSGTEGGGGPDGAAKSDMAFPQAISGMDGRNFDEDGCDTYVVLVERMAKGRASHLDRLLRGWFLVGGGGAIRSWRAWSQANDDRIAGSK